MPYCLNKMNLNSQEKNLFGYDTFKIVLNCTFTGILCFCMFTPGVSFNNTFTNNDVIMIYKFWFNIVPVIVVCAYNRNHCKLQ